MQITMPNHFTLQIAISDRRQPDGALGLLVPVPPGTPHQTLDEIQLPATWKGIRVSDRMGVQTAVFATPAPGTHNTPILYTLQDEGKLDADHFICAHAKEGAPSPDVLELANEMGLAEIRSDTERLEKIVAALAAKFQYLSGYTNDAPLTCDLLTGNCLSINEAMLKLAHVGGVRCAYYIGYFFENANPLQSKDWHCWVSSLTARGFDSWDIAHHLKRGMEKVRPGINPLAGTRFATCVGQDLTFELLDATVNVPHLCEPRWILPGGATKPCEVTVTLERVKASLDQMAMAQ